MEYHLNLLLETGQTNCADDAFVRAPVVQLDKLLPSASHHTEYYNHSSPLHNMEVKRKAKLKKIPVFTIYQIKYGEIQLFHPSSVEVLQHRQTSSSSTHDMCSQTTLFRRVQQIFEVNNKTNEYQYHFYYYYFYYYY